MTTNIIKTAAAWALCVGSAGPAFATHSRLNSVFVGKNQTKIKGWRLWPASHRTNKDAVVVLEEHNGVVTMREGGSEPKTIGHLFYNRDVGGLRHGKALFDGPENIAAMQQSLDEAARARGIAKTPVQIANV